MRSDEFIGIGRLGVTQPLSTLTVIRFEQSCSDIRNQGSAALPPPSLHLVSASHQAPSKEVINCLTERLVCWHEMEIHYNIKALQKLISQLRLSGGYGQGIYGWCLVSTWFGDGTGHDSLTGNEVS